MVDMTCTQSPGMNRDMDCTSSVEGQTEVADVAPVPVLPDDTTPCTAVGQADVE